MQKNDKNFWRFYAVIFTIAMVFILSGILANAYTAPDGFNYDYYIATTDYGNNNFRFKVFSNQKICLCSSYMQSGEYMIITGIAHDDLIDVGVVQAVANSNAFEIRTNGFTNNSIIRTDALLDGYLCNFNDGQVTTSPTMTIVGSSVPDSIPVFTTAQECVEYIQTPDVDYENVLYSPLIPTVQYNVFCPPFGIDLFQQANIPQKLFVISVDGYEDYYLQMIGRTYIPRLVNCNIYNGQYNYEVKQYYLTPYQNLAVLGGNVVADNFVFDGSEYVWSPSFYNVSYTTDNTYWKLQGNEQLFEDCYTQYDEYLRWVLPCYGNQLEIYARLYKVVDGQVYVGAWNHWVSDKQSVFTEELPSSVVQQAELPGQKETSYNVDAPDESNTNVFYGEATGLLPEVVSYVIQNVPNYPDYPTVADYNKDNLLVSMINSTSIFENCFGEFSDFCQDTFAFIPSEIWALIAFGFTLTILAFFLRLL